MRASRATSTSLPRRLLAPSLALLVALAALGASPAAAAGDPTVVTGVKAGPVSITAQRRTVASLALPAGGWFVTASAHLRARDGTLSDHLGVDCRLGVGGVTDVAHATPTAKDYWGSRVSLSLTAVGRLTSPGSARLSCAGEVDGAVAIRDIRLVAMKAGRLTTRTTSPGGTTSGSGKPRIISIRAGTVHDVPLDGSLWSVGSLYLPRGRWWVTAKAVAQGDLSSSPTNGSYRCRLDAGGDFDELEFGLTAQGSAGDAVSLGLQVVHSFSLPGVADLVCGGTPSFSQTFSVARIVITAVKAGRLTNRWLGGGGTTSGTGSPRVISGWHNGPYPVAQGGSFQTLASMSLPAGRWSALAKLWIETDGIPADAVDRLAVCRIAFGSRSDGGSIHYGGNANHDWSSPMVMTLTWSSAEPGPVELQCRRDTGHTGTIRTYFYKVTAIRLGWLVQKPL